MADMLRADLAAARAEWIQDAQQAQELARREQSDFLAETDREGHVVDFHGLRHTFITNLATSGVHPKVAQELARHSHIGLTKDRYTHAAWESMADALDRLPSITPVERETQRATGTDGQKSVAFCVAREGAFESVSVHSDAMKPADKPTPKNAKNPEKTAFSQGNSEVRLLGLEPRTYGLKVRCSTD